MFLIIIHKKIFFLNGLRYLNAIFWPMEVRQLIYFMCKFEEVSSRNNKMADIRKSSFNTKFEVIVKSANLGLKNNRRDACLLKFSPLSICTMENFKFYKNLQKANSQKFSKYKNFKKSAKLSRKPSDEFPRFFLPFIQDENTRRPF